MIKIDLINARRVFDEEVSYQSELIKRKALKNEEMLLTNIKRKVIHTDEVIQDGLNVSDELSFNESVRDFAHVALMDHDIGCFAQLRNVGNFDDGDLERYTGILNHGVLGKVILGGMLYDQLPSLVDLYKPIKRIVKGHVDKVISDKDLMVLNTGLLSDYSIEELLSGKHRKSVISVMTQIIQDVDKLNFSHQIIEGRWQPKKSDEEISPVVFEMFYNGEHLDMADLVKKGLWNSNVGDLIRLGFINQIKLVSVAKVIQKESIIMKLREKRQNPMVQDSFGYTEKRLNEMINNSNDGIILSKTR